MFDHLPGEVDLGRGDVEDIEFSHPAMKVMMPLMSMHDGEPRCMGTAFAVAPGLAITAHHVVDGIYNYQQQRDRFTLGESGFSILAFQWFEGQFYPWIVDAVYSSSVADTAFLRFIKPDWWGHGESQIRPACARLSFNPPEVGDEVEMFGLPDSTIENGVLILRPMRSSARVTNIELKRDGKLYPRSRIDVEGELLHGMSGGPCFHKDGGVIGVNSSAWEGFRLAHVALLWPALNVEIDLFKSGAFPVIDLFTKHASMRALGYRRVHVTSKGVLLGKIDPDELKPLRLPRLAKELSGALDFSATSAQAALSEIRISIDSALSHEETLHVNRLHGSLRRFFWELDAALRVALTLAAAKVGIQLDGPVNWDEFALAFENRLDREAVDELAALKFSWYGADLFEVRTYAELCREGSLRVEEWSREGVGLIEVVLGQCWKGGKRVQIPDGLDRYFESARRFVHRLLDAISNRGLNVPA